MPRTTEIDPGETAADFSVSSARERAEAAPGGPLTRERVRELLQAEVDKQGALDEARRAVVLIGESSIRFVEEPEPGFFIAGPDGQPRMSVHDGHAAPFTLADLAAELRRNYPALFKPDGPDAAAAPPNEAIETPPARDWLMVGSGEPAAAVETDAPAEAVPGLQRQEAVAGDEAVAKDASVEAVPSPAPTDVVAPAQAPPPHDQHSLDTIISARPVETVPADRFATQRPGVAPVPGILPPSDWLRPSYAIYGGVALLAGTILALIVTGSGSETTPDAASNQPAKVGAAPVPASPAAPAPGQGSQKPPGALSGVPEIVDTSTLRIDGRVVRLFGVEWERGAQAEDLTRYIAGREVICTPVVRSDRHRCVVEGRDLSEVVLYNGGGRATPEATPELKAAEAKARTAGLGVWQKP
jgi:endonuclease YncB( thermonuclease family)